MKFNKLSLMTVAILLAAGCAKEFDDTAIKDRLDTLEEQVQDNANAIKKLDGKLEEAAQKGLTVTVTPVAGGNKLEFSDGTSVTVMDGAKGEPGVQGKPGTDGTGTEVTITESADGKSYVINVGGKEYSVLKTVKFSLDLQVTELAMAPGETSEISYTVTGADASVAVFVNACSGYSADVDAANSKVVITAPAELPEKGFVIVTARNGSTGEETSQYIAFLKGNLTVTADAQTVEAEGGIVTLTVNADCSYNVVIPEGCTWIQQVQTKAMTTSYVYLKVAENTNTDVRTAIIKITSSAGANEVVIVQNSSDKTMAAANCFIVSEAGLYRFKTVKGNSNESVGDVTSCELLWETYNTEEYPEKNTLIKSVSYADGVIAFETVDTFKEGNAGIAAKDAAGNILWSWHIWLTDKPAEQEYYNNAGTFFDRNLGALSATPGEVQALGLLYQWGRKDPFLGSSSIEKSQQTGSTLMVVHDNAQYSDWPTLASTAECGTIEWSIAHPTTFIGYSDQEYGKNHWDWLYSEDWTVTDNTRWNPDTKTIYDPCPAGWRIPGIDVYRTMSGTSSSYTDSACADMANFGCNWGGKFGDDETIWYPLSGDRGQSFGNLSQVATDGFVWTSTPVKDGVKAYILYNDIDADAAYSHMGRSRDRSKAYTVRCMKE